MPVIPVSLAEMAAHLRRRQRQQQECARQRVGRLLALLPGAKAILAGRGAARIWLFGSLARGDAGPASDVALAVEGLAGADYFPALAELMAHFGGR